MRKSSLSQNLFIVNFTIPRLTSPVRMKKKALPSSPSWMMNSLGMKVRCKNVQTNVQSLEKRWGPSQCYPLYCTILANPESERESLLWLQLPLLQSPAAVKDRHRTGLGVVSPWDGNRKRRGERERKHTQGMLWNSMTQELQDSLPIAHNNLECFLASAFPPYLHSRYGNPAVLENALLAPFFSFFLIQNSIPQILKPQLALPLRSCFRGNVGYCFFHYFFFQNPANILGIMKEIKKGIFIAEPMHLSCLHLVTYLYHT